MAADPLDTLRLKLMQDVLPVGLAVVDRVRRGGAKDVVAAFQGAEGNPLTQLRQEGEAAASQVREQLDRFSPGLGNPVMKVTVRDVPRDPAAGPFDGLEADAPLGAEELQQRLSQIATRLELLEQRLGAP